jgi:hypothetical protein
MFVQGLNKSVLSDTIEPSWISALQSKLLIFGAVVALLEQKIRTVQRSDPLIAFAKYTQGEVLEFFKKDVEADLGAERAQRLGGHIKSLISLERMFGISE